MASITIRNLDKKLKARLRIQAARNNRSMEEEVRSILHSALAAESNHTTNLAESIQNKFAPVGGVDLPEINRENIREPVDFEQ